MLDEPHSPRYEWIDISKGVGILAVILCHSMIPMLSVEILYSTVAFLTSFVMVLFFILAGMTYNGEKHRENLRNYAVSRGRQLLIPYIAIYFIMILLFIPLAGSIDTYLTPLELVIWFLYGAGPPGQPTYLWFLPVLYFGLLLFTAIESATHTNDPKIRWPLVAILPFFAFWMTDVFSPMLVPWRLNDVLLTTAFCIVGYEMKRYRDLKPWHTDSKIRDGAIFLILIAFLFVVSQYNGFISPADDWYGTNGWLYLISGIIGAVVIFMLSSISTSSMASRKMQFLGVNSQVIYEVHPIFFYLVPVLLGLFGLSTLDYDTSFALIWPIRFVLAFGLSIPFTLLVSRNRFLSLIFKGKSRE
ncbi:MAG: acyltransferase family protein [Candidatus Thorarchaeota archaeon]|jgi:fucose 4-O-acetylase-like acetyltransferase